MVGTGVTAPAASKSDDGWQKPTVDVYLELVPDRIAVRIQAAAEDVFLGVVLSRGCPHDDVAIVDQAIVIDVAQRSDRSAGLDVESRRVELYVRSTLRNAVGVDLAGVHAP